MQTVYCFHDAIIQIYFMCLFSLIILYFEHYFVVLVILKPNTSVIAEPNIFKIRKDSEASRSLIVPDFTISVYGSSGNSLSLLASFSLFCLLFLFVFIFNEAWDD